MKAAILLFLTVGLLCGGLGAQSTGALQGSWVHLDKPFYVTEDPIGFQLYLAPEFAEEEIVVQSILFDAVGQARLYAYWSNEGENALAGKMIAPPDLPTGWYYLSFRAWDEERQTERVLLQAPIAIYNDREPITPERVSRQEPSRQSASVMIPKKELTITIDEPVTTLAAGSSMQLNLGVTDRRGRPVRSRVSVSIADWGTMGVAPAMGMDNLQAGDSLYVVTPATLSEQLYWQGEYLTETGAAASGQPLLLKIGSQEQSITTDERNRIFWTTDPSRARLPLQLRTEDGKIAKARFRPAPGRLALGQLFYSPAAFRYLEINRQRKTLLSVTEDERPPQTGRYQNDADTDVLSELVGVDDSRELNWRYAGTGVPYATTLLWRVGRSGEDGSLKLNYRHPEEATTYRIDIVAQDDTGRRGRKTVFYRVE